MTRLSDGELQAIREWAALLPQGPWEVGQLTAERGQPWAITTEFGVQLVATPLCLAAEEVAEVQAMARIPEQIARLLGHIASQSGK